MFLLPKHALECSQEPAALSNLEARFSFLCRVAILVAVRFLLVPVLPCLAAADAAAFEGPAIAVFDDDIVGGEQMALLTGGEFCLDHRSLQAVMGWVAAGFADTDRELARTDLISLGNRPYEALPE